MKIIKNTSDFSTVKLKSLFCTVHNLLAKAEGRLKHWKHLKVVVRDKNFGYSGRAYLGRAFGSGWDMFLSVEKRLAPTTLAYLFAHELMHSYGYNHKEYRDDPLTEKQYDFIRDKYKNVIMRKIKKEKPKKDLILIRFNRMLKREKVWDRKLKLATSHLKKVKKEIKVYKKRHNKVS
tara:strand:- start:51 stop:581 length:531 start_codon:yes stop_codon:yes gene_type:complete